MSVKRGEAQKSTSYTCLPGVCTHKAPKTQEQSRNVTIRDSALTFLTLCFRMTSIKLMVPKTL